MNSREMMKALTISKAVFSFARKKHKDKAFFYEFLRKVAHRVEIDKDIDWTPENINYFMHFVVKSRDFYSKNFKIGTMFEIFEVGLKTLHQFNVSELANFTVLSLSIDYEAYEQVYKELVIKFNNETTFNHYSQKHLSNLILGLLVKRDANWNKIQVEQTDFKPEPMIALKEATLKKLEFDYDLSKFIAVVNSGFSNIKGPVKQEVLDLIASKIALEVDPNNLDVEMRYENIYAENLLVFIRDFDSSHSQARELFYRITTKIFVAQVTKEYSYFSSQGLGQRLQFLKEYLIVAHTYQAFQLVFLDLSILMIHQILENKNFSVDFVTMCQIMKSLAALSYSDRFNSYMAHKETQIEKWQNILVRSDEIFSNSTNEYMENMEIIKEDDSDIEIESFTGLAIDYLWAMCVFDFYSKTSLQKAISTLILNNEEIHGQEMISMLTQIHYWLKLEHGDEIKLDSNIVKKLENFKYKWNKQQNLGRTSGLKEAIKMTMDSQKQEYIENYSDFPYVLDFSSRLGHNAILVDDENSFLEGSDGLIRSGFNKVMLRQLVPMGWSVKRYDLKSWIKSGNGDVFGLQTL